MNTIRDNIDNRLKELNKKRWWVARHENLPCHPETFMRFMRGERDTCSRVLDAVFSILGMQYGAAPTEAPSSSPFHTFAGYKDLVDACYYRRWKGFRVPDSLNEQIEAARLAHTTPNHCARDLPDPNSDIIKTTYPMQDYEIKTGEAVYGY